MTRRELLSRRAEILALATLHGARNVRLFGSVARDQATDMSDVDLLVEMGTDHSPWFPSGLRLDLTELLGVQVEVVTEGMLAPDIRAHALAQAIPL